MLKRVLGGLAVLLAIILVAGGAYLWDPLPKNPDAETLSADAANYDAEIIREDDDDIRRGLVPMDLFRRIDRGRHNGQENQKKAHIGIMP